MSAIDRVAVIGLDCAEPSLVFGPWLAEMPNLRRLCQSGTFGQLTSCLPPITVPAWSCMAASQDPGQLGIYGFRNRKDWSYDGLDIALSTHVRVPRVWDHLSAAGRGSIVVGVPGTFPITKPIRGAMVGCFLTPDPKTSDYTWPRELKQTIAALVGDYLVDVKGFRTDDKAPLLDQIYAMTDRRFKVVDHLARTTPWDLLWMVEMGTDRIHHGFWQYHDPQHHRHQPGSRFNDAIRKYYVHLDQLIGELLTTLDPQRTAVLVVSDHGAKRMDGGLCFNDWLIREGYLVLKEPATRPSKFNLAAVDWSRTRVWGEGGYYGRCFINVRGREPAGVVAPADYEPLRDELIRKLEALPDDRGRPMGTRVYRPQAIYRRVEGVPPDLIAIFGDLHWRSVGTVGNPSIYTFDNDTGPDDANHAQEGMYILAHPSLPARGRVDGPTLYDVAPTILKLLRQPVPAEMIGGPLI
ncbi:MAG: alkaline phosphatase family protein [Phycisphaerae bacterium]